jgi:tRNA-specific 2-thiouridylase
MIPENLEDRLRKQAKPYYYRLKDGKVVGEHEGAHFYTIGQRKGLGIGGYEKPLFIIATDVNENVIYVGEGDTHPGLYRKTLRIMNEEVHWVRPDKALKPGESAEYNVRIRYRQPLQKAVLYQLEDGLYVDFRKEQQSITPGQFAVWYEKDEVIGSGPINE